MQKNNQTNAFLNKFSLKYPKLLKFLKSNVKAFLITGVIVFAITASATAVKILHSRQVRYKNERSVETAINELYEKLDDCKLVKMGCKGCTKLEYLESTGTQYIDTNYVASQDTNIIIDFRTKSAGNAIFGSRSSTTARNYSFVRISDNSWASGYGSSYIFNKTANNDRHVLTKGKLVYIDDTLLYTHTDNNFTTPTSLILFGMYANKYVSSNVIIFSTTISENGTLVRDYIPVLDSNDRPCLFDKVEKKCYYNQGTGEFLYG